MKSGIWQAHRPDVVSINLYVKNISNGSRVQPLFTKCHSFGPDIALVDEKWHLAIPFTRSCYYYGAYKILSKYPIIFLWQFPFFTFLALALTWSVKSGIWQAHCLKLVSYNLCGKNYQSNLMVQELCPFRLNVQRQLQKWSTDGSQTVHR